MISIVIPVFNGEEYIEKCVESCLAQTYKDIEIIIVDDASTDATRDIISNYEKAYPNLVKGYFQCNNCKQGAARNVGIRAAKGEFIMFVDSDDYVSEDICRLMIDRQNESGADIVCGDVWVEKDGTLTISTTIPNATLEGCNIDLIRCMDCAPWAKLIRRSLIVDNQLYFPEGIFFEDSGITPAWMLVAKKVEKLAVPVYYYVQREFSTCHSNSDIEKDLDALKSLDYLNNVLIGHGIADKYSELFAMFSTFRVRDTWGRILAKFNGGSLYSFQQLQKTIKKYAENIEDNSYFKMCYYPSDRNLLLSIRDDTYDVFKYKLEHPIKMVNNTSVDYFQSQEQRIRKIVNSIIIGEESVIVWGMGKKGIGLCKIIDEAYNVRIYPVDKSEDVIGKTVGRNLVVQKYEDVKDFSNVILTTNTSTYNSIYMETSNKKLVDIFGLLRYGVY